MKYTRTLLLLVISLFWLGNRAYSQTSEPWTSKDLMDPSVLANMMSDPKAEKVVIFNIGPLANIKGAVKTGAAGEKQNLDALRTQLQRTDKNKTVVIYCGCCPFRNCPNVRPAFNLLKSMGFTKAKLLNLPHNLKTDWMEPGFPMD
jgi:thiosulfate/3-mercaptopyruvate sulfurtransferase